MEASTKKDQINSGSPLSMSKVFGYLVKNAFAFTVGVMALVHLGLIVIFLLAGVLPLVRFNCLSVIVYIFCYVLCRFGHIMPA